MDTLGHDCPSRRAAGSELQRSRDVAHPGLGRGSSRRPLSWVARCRELHRMDSGGAARRGAVQRARLLPARRRRDGELPRPSLRSLALRLRDDALRRGDPEDAALAFLLTIACRKEPYASCIFGPLEGSIIRELIQGCPECFADAETRNVDLPYHLEHHLSREDKRARWLLLAFGG